MRLPLLLAGALLLVATARAETPYNCNAGYDPRIRISSDRTTFRIRGTFATFGFDPATTGLGIDISYEPETDPANGIFSVVLPNTGFTPAGTGLVYRDKAGTVGGVTSVKITGTLGLQKVRVTRKGTALPAGPADGTLRVVLTSGAACVRACGSPCHLTKSARQICRQQPTGLAPNFCGIRSGCELLAAPNAPGPGNHCMLPYPSSFFEKDDPSTVTGKRIDYKLLAMPKNNNGVHIDAAPYASLDGYSPGPIIMAHFLTGVDLALSNIPPQTNFPASVDPGSPTVLIEADSPGCVRVEHFGENDVSLRGDGMAPITAPNQVFIIRPGKRLKNGTRYIVALRDLIDQDGNPLPAPPGFLMLKNDIPSGQPALEARRDAMNAILDKLDTDCGVPRTGLVLAWDFTTASDDAIERYLISMRDQTFALLGPGNSPAFTITNVETPPLLNNSNTTADPRICRRVTGTYTVPLFTTFDGPGSLLNIGPMNLPVQNGTTQAPFTAVIPCSLFNGQQAGRPVFYGHGLLGTGAGEVTAGNLRDLAENHGFVIAATDWQGFSASDLGTIAGFIGNLSGFRKLPERLHQGILNQLVLGRLLGAPNGLSSHPAFQWNDGMNMGSFIDPSEVFYYGNSQGGIMGGAVMGVAQEVTRGVLGVPAANFSTLLQRSRDFDTYFILLRAGYPNDIERAMTFPLLQQLWDRAEPNGYYHHTVSNPLPSTPAHKVLVLMARGDDEVANIATEIMVRSMGIPQVTPVVQSYYNIAEMAAPFDGSAMFESDFGVPPVPTTNTPPADNNVHGAMRALPEIQQTISDFLQTGGMVVNNCSGVCDPN